MTRTHWLCLGGGIFVALFLLVLGRGASREGGAAGYSEWSARLKEGSWRSILAPDLLTAQSFVSERKCWSPPAFILRDAVPCTVRIRRSSSRLRSADLVLRSGGQVRLEVLAGGDRLKIVPAELSAPSDSASVFVKRAESSLEFRIRCGRPPCRIEVVADG